MCKMENIQIRIDENLKKEFENFCSNTGVNISSAVTMLANSCCLKNELPFEIEDSVNVKIKDGHMERIAIRIEQDKKKRFAAFCDDRGLTMSIVIRMFMIKCVKTRKMPL